MGSVQLYLLKEERNSQFNYLKKIMMESNIQGNNPVDERLREKMQLQLSIVDSFFSKHCQCERRHKSIEE